MSREAAETEVPSPASDVSFRVPQNLGEGLLSDFISEATDHLEIADQNLLTLERDAADKASLDAVFRALHSVKGTAGFLGLDGIKILGHAAEDMLERVRSGEMASNPAVIDCVFDTVAFLKRIVADFGRGLGEATDAIRRQEAAGVHVRIRALLASAASRPAGEAAAADDTPADTEVAVPADALEADVFEAWPAEESEATVVTQALPQPTGYPEEASLPSAPSEPSVTAQPAARKETVKVDAERLDRLLDTIGELVIAESMVLNADEIKGRVSAQLVRQMAQLDKITRELQEMGTSLRMVPVRPVFQKMARLVRDIAKQNGKAVEFVTVGEDTELDKTVVERICDPLVHMLRNSLDHGIEADPEDRVRAGKPAVATVKLSAFQKGGNVCLEIADDGRGLDREAILAKARERGLLREDADPSDKEVWNFIFDAGFSTARQVTDLSGRGVGMDVVKSNIESLRGRIEIQSRPGRGAVFSIWLPLTLAIIDGMVVRIGEERYVFPTLSVVRIVPLRDGDLHAVQGKGDMVRLEGELVPLFPLRGYFHPGEGRAIQASRLILIAESEGRKAAFPVDELLGQQQIVIKKFEKAFRNLPGIAGGAILSDGRVGMILDLDGLMKLGF